jgi:hypothetical protein
MGVKLARLNVVSAPATGFSFTVDTTEAKTPYYSDYPDGTTVTITWPKTQHIESRRLILSRVSEYEYQRTIWGKNVVEAPSVSISLPAGTTTVTGIYRISSVSMSGPLGVWWFPLLSRIFQVRL